MRETRFPVPRARATARLLCVALMVLVPLGCDGAGRGTDTAQLTVRTKRYMGSPATITYTFNMSYFGQGPSGGSCANSFSETVTHNGNTPNDGNAYDDKVFLGRCPGAWNISVSADTWSTQCQKTLAVGNNHAYFTFGKAGCHPTAYP
jgi:hypothetical protein